MPLAGMIFPILLSVAAAEEPITVQGYPWAPFISPMGEPFRGGPSAVAPIARWFRQADRNQDGMLIAEEIQFDADRFFARLDSNRNSQIEPDELVIYEQEVAPEIQVNSDWRTPRGQKRKSRRDEHDGYHIDGLQGAARYGLLNIPQPVASADVDFNRVITLTEFKQAASYRFKLLDGGGQGRITLPELEARLPIRPKGKRAKHRKNEPDARIGLPLPEGD